MATVLDFLDSSFEHFPDKTAYLDETESLTYRELRTKAKAFGSFIHNTYQCKKEPILILMEKSVKNIVCFLGTLYSGNFYCPVDVLLSDFQIQNIIKTLNPRIIITESEHCERAENIIGNLKLQIPIHTYNVELFNSIDEESLAIIRKSIIDTDIMYVVFTSGSTGVPKGVCAAHRGLVNHINNFIEAVNITDSDIIGNRAPFNFDGSTKDIYGALKTGAEMHIIPPKMFTYPHNLIKYLIDNKITTLMWTVSAFTMVANAKAFNCGVPTSVNKIMSSGEAMPVKQLNYWRSYIPDALYVSLYGPTEITVNCLYYIVDRQFDDTEVLPLGKPFSNIDVMVLNEDYKPISGDEIGEIYVRSSNLAMGYYNNPEMTKEAFIQNPLNDKYLETVYRTGDLAKLNNKGELIFLSRKDFQIKHLGFRIELTEIEIAVNSLELIETAVCLYNSEKDKIVLVYKGEADKKYILEGLKQRLPKYMFPQAFHKTDTILYAINGKIDRVKMKEVYIDAEN